MIIESDVSWSHISKCRCCMVLMKVIFQSSLQTNASLKTFPLREHLLEVQVLKCSARCLEMEGFQVARIAGGLSRVGFRKIADGLSHWKEISGEFCYGFILEATQASVPDEITRTGQKHRKERLQTPTELLRFSLCTAQFQRSHVADRPNERHLIGLLCDHSWMLNLSSFLS